MPADLYYDWVDVSKCDKSEVFTEKRRGTELAGEKYQKAGTTITLEK